MPASDASSCRSGSWLRILTLVRAAILSKGLLLSLQTQLNRRPPSASLFPPSRRPLSSPPLSAARRPVARHRLLREQRAQLHRRHRLEPHHRGHAHPPQVPRPRRVRRAPPRPPGPSPPPPLPHSPSQPHTRLLTPSPPLLPTAGRRRPQVRRPRAPHHLRHGGHDGRSPAGCVRRLRRAAGADGARAGERAERLHRPRRAGPRCGPVPPPRPWAFAILSCSRTGLDSPPLSRFPYVRCPCVRSGGAPGAALPHHRRLLLPLGGGRAQRLARLAAPLGLLRPGAL